MTDAELAELLGSDSGVSGEYELGRKAAQDEIRRGFNDLSIFEIKNALSTDWIKGYVEIWKLKKTMDRTKDLLSI